MRSTGLRVRVASQAYAEQVAEIYAPHCTDGLASLEVVAPTGAEMAARIRTTTETHPWLVAVDVSQPELVLGYAYASRHHQRAGYRWSVDVAVYVGAAATGRGVGRTLYGALLRLLAAQGFHQAYAVIGMPNEASTGLHRSCGFEPVGTFREAGFKHGAWRDVQWWGRALDGHPGGGGNAVHRPAVDAGGPGWVPPEPIDFPDLPAELVTALLTAPV